MNFFVTICKQLPKYSSLSIYKQFPRDLSFRKFSTKLKMSPTEKGDFIGMQLDDIIKKLESFASISLAESWDNVGLLINPMVSGNIKNILLTNDLTEEVVHEAGENNVGLIISYHPPIFKPIKALTGSTWKDRIAINCIQKGIAVYSPHTSWDVIQGGVNDWLASAFDTISCQAATDTGCGRKMELSSPIKISEALHKVKKHIGIPLIQLALGVGKTMDTEISSVALCAGAGSMVLNGLSADLYLTGEMSHHDVLDAAQKGISVILCNHSNSERGFLKEFAPKLAKTLLESKVNVLVSLVDKDPLTVV